MGGFQEGGFQIVERAAFSSRGNLLYIYIYIAREFLLKIDTSLAIATSGLRTNLLFEKPPLSENHPFEFPDPQMKIGAPQKRESQPRRIQPPRAKSKTRA